MATSTFKPGTTEPQISFDIAPVILWPAVKRKHRERPGKEDEQF